MRHFYRTSITEGSFSGIFRLALLLTDNHLNLDQSATLVRFLHLWDMRGESDFRAPECETKGIARFVAAVTTRLCETDNTLLTVYAVPQERRSRELACIMRAAVRGAVTRYLLLQYDNCDPTQLQAAFTVDGFTLVGLCDRTQKAAEEERYRCHKNVEGQWYTY